MVDVRDISWKTIGESIKNGAADLLSSSDFISRTIGMNNSYEDIMFIVQSLGREPISLLGKDYAFIFDHVRRNYLQGTYVDSKNHKNCPKFTLYKDTPTVRFADPYNDPMDWKDRWVSNFKTQTTFDSNTTIHYSESTDGNVDNIKIENQNANHGVANGNIVSYGPDLNTCDLIKKTNDNFNDGLYQTLVARFHTNKQSYDDPTQTAISRYGMSHGRNLLVKNPNKVSPINKYDNPYCRVWTYHHQYNQIARQIRPFEGENGSLNQDKLEKAEGNGGSVSFKTLPEDNFQGGSMRLDKYGVLNYYNGTVNIAPTAKIKDYFDGKQSDYDKQIIETKKCMFSIENLAWKDDKSVKNEYDANGLSPEQKGPLGGRIMWFPPYDISFSEDVTVNWNSNQFIGRGEKVYTYTDTERKGNLSFTLLIDHPSIIDYWNRKDRDTSKQLIIGNSGGVTQTNNEENTLLRFFAGCDILSANPQRYDIKAVEPIITNGSKTPTEADETREDLKKTICAILYYPNNYSGTDDGNNNVNPIHYLMNGVGTQKYVNGINDTDDIPTNISIQPSVFDEEGTTVQFDGGYEVHKSDFGLGGISLTISELEPNFDIISSTYADTKTKVIKAQYLTSPIGLKYKATYGSNTYDLAKIVGSEAMSLGNAKTESNLTREDHLWYRKRYYYRVDKKYENQEFSNPKSYIDARSYALNSDGYDIRQTTDSGSGYEFMRYFELKDDSENYRLISFTDLFVALEGDNTVIRPTNSENMELVKEVLTNKERYNNVKISFNGHASYQGYSESNNNLAMNRALTLRKWLTSFKSVDGIQTTEPKVINQQQDVKTNVGHVDDRNVKIWRSAAVIIEYEEKNISDAATTESVQFVFDKDGNTIPRTERIETKNKETSLSEQDVIALSLKVPNHDKLNNLGNEEETAQNTSEGEYIVNRYDNEGEFFKVLTRESPFLHNLISEKIKYFDPAFHSISPEGFNARLTFLHQCTRQGPTVEDSIGQGTAYNLAFGRPPICVLRLGDFYYTKITINSLTINYETPQWDMNPEGIGMMPMFAKITIGFNFLGGSDLAGPIARLQNAVSFNYYANASVYDNRAEKVEYEANGSGKETQFKGYTYPNVSQNQVKVKKEDVVREDNKKKKKKPVIEFGDISILDSYNYDTNTKTSWEDKIYMKGNENIS